MQVLNFCLFSFMSLDFTDEQLAQESQKSLQAFEYLVERYENPLLRYILRISHFSKEEAEEILQEIFIQVWKNIKDFNPQLKFKSWVYRIAHNHTISAFRKTRSKSRDSEVPWNPELYENISDHSNFVAEFNAQMDAKIVQNILENLPQKYKDVLVLRYFEDQGYEEISDILKIPIGTAATLVRRAKQAFIDYTRKHNISF